MQDFETRFSSVITQFEEGLISLTEFIVHLNDSGYNVIQVFRDSKNCLILQFNKDDKYGSYKFNYVIGVWK